MGKLFSGGAKAIGGLFKGGRAVAKAGSAVSKVSKVGSAASKVGQTASRFSKFTKPITSMGTKIASHVSPGLAKATSAFDKASTYISPFI